MAWKNLKQRSLADDLVGSIPTKEREVPQDYA